MEEKILCVDDESNVLLAYKRQLRSKFCLYTASSGEDGLQVLHNERPFAVVISDMQMPGMNGIDFLSRVREHMPDTTRIMLTGQANLSTAIHAVNEGNIFRFLTKPCTPEVLEKTIMTGIEQYRLITAERELLKNTLTGSIKILVELMSIVNPMVFSRSNRIKRCVRYIAKKLDLHNRWQYEVAGMLSQIGSVTIPSDILDKLYSNVVLDEKEENIYKSYPEIGYKLIRNIPRLEKIALMIKNQQRPCKDFAPLDINSKDEMANIGAQILKVTLDFDQLVFGGIDINQALLMMRKNEKEYNPMIMDALRDIRSQTFIQRSQMVTVKEIYYGMVACQDIKTGDGRLVVPKDQEMTYAVIARLQNFARRTPIAEPFKVMLPEERSE